MSKVALITGITGQDGAMLANFLLGKDYKVIGVVRRSSTNTFERLEYIKDQITIEEGDITDAFCMNNLIEKYSPDEVYNLAAMSHVGTSFNQPNLTWDVTAGGVLNILESIRIHKKPIKFYQASSSEMFGKNYTIKRVFDGYEYKEFKFQNEETSMLPQSPYAIAKLAAHHLVRLYRESYGIFACAGILFNHEGPTRGENFVTRKITKYVGQLHKHLYTGPTPNLPFPKLKLGNLKARRDWGYAGDYVRAMWMMLQKPAPDDFVIATGETHTIEEFLTLSFSLAQLPAWENFVEIDPALYRPAEVDYLLGDCSKAREKLGWSSECSFNELVKMMVEHDIAHA